MMQAANAVIVVPAEFFSMHQYTPSREMLDDDDSRDSEPRSGTGKCEEFEKWCLRTAGYTSWTNLGVESRLQVHSHLSFED